MKSFISIFLIISCIAVISLKDTLRSIHSLLHHIPNPFHTHHHIHNHNHGHSYHSHHSGDEHTHTHTHRSDHHSSEGQHHYSESSHNEKAVKEGDNLAHDHDVLEHFGLKNQKEESALGGRKKGEKKSFKFQWYPGVYYQYDFHREESLSDAYLSGNNNLILIYNQNPPSPPPEYTLL